MSQPENRAGSAAGEPPVDPELPELPDLAELQELPELPEPEHLPELPESVELQELPDDAIATRPAPSPPAPAAAPAPAPPARPESFAPPGRPADPARSTSSPASPPPPAPPVSPGRAAVPAPAPAAPAPAPATEPAAPTPAGAPASEGRTIAAAVPPLAVPTGPAPAPAPAAGEGPAAAETSAAGAMPGAMPGAMGGAADPFGGERPPLRQLDPAPAHLRKAAVIVVVGSLLPWMGHGGGWMTSVLAKVLALLGVWFWYQQVEHNWGPKRKGLLGKLAELVLVPKKKPEDEGEKRAARRKAQQQPATSIAHPFPTALHVLSLVTIVVACFVVPARDAQAETKVTAMAELGMLAWAAFTWVHIHAYERWGHFNPIFPLMFLAMLLGGILRVAVGFAGGIQGFEDAASVLGGAVVAYGGGFAAYTIVEALRSAKREGDVKKQAQVEARRAARATRRGSDS